MWYEGKEEEVENANCVHEILTTYITQDESKVEMNYQQLLQEALSKLKKNTHVLNLLFYFNTLENIKLLRNNNIEPQPINEDVSKLAHTRLPHYKRSTEIVKHIRNQKLPNWVNTFQNDFKFKDIMTNYNATVKHLKEQLIATPRFMTGGIQSPSKIVQFQNKRILSADFKLAMNCAGYQPNLKDSDTIKNTVVNIKKHQRIYLLLVQCFKFFTSSIQNDLNRHENLEDKELVFMLGIGLEESDNKSQRFQKPFGIKKKIQTNTKFAAKVEELRLSYNRNTGNNLPTMLNILQVLNLFVNVSTYLATPYDTGVKTASKVVYCMYPNSIDLLRFTSVVGVQSTRNSIDYICHDFLNSIDRTTDNHQCQILDNLEPFYKYGFPIYTEHFIRIFEEHKHELSTKMRKEINEWQTNDSGLVTIHFYDTLLKNITIVSDAKFIESLSYPIQINTWNRSISLSTCIQSVNQHNELKDMSAYICGTDTTKYNSNCEWSTIVANNINEKNKTFNFALIGTDEECKKEFCKKIIPNNSNNSSLCNGLTAMEDSDVITSSEKYKEVLQNAIKVKKRQDNNCAEMLQVLVTCNTKKCASQQFKKQKRDDFSCIVPEEWPISTSSTSPSTDDYSKYVCEVLNIIQEYNQNETPLDLKTQMNCDTFDKVNDMYVDSDDANSLLKHFQTHFQTELTFEKPMIDTFTNKLINYMTDESIGVDASAVAFVVHQMLERHDDDYFLKILFDFVQASIHVPLKGELVQAFEKYSRFNNKVYMFLTLNHTEPQTTLNHDNSTDHDNLTDLVSIKANIVNTIANENFNKRYSDHILLFPDNDDYEIQHGENMYHFEDIVYRINEEHYSEKKSWWFGTLFCCQSNNRKQLNIWSALINTILTPNVPVSNVLDSLCQLAFYMNFMNAKCFEEAKSLFNQKVETYLTSLETMEQQKKSERHTTINDKKFKEWIIKNDLQEGQGQLDPEYKVAISHLIHTINYKCTDKKYRTFDTPHLLLLEASFTQCMVEGDFTNSSESTNTTDSSVENELQTFFKEKGKYPKFKEHEDKVYIHTSYLTNELVLQIIKECCGGKKEKKATQEIKAALVSGSSQTTVAINNYQLTIYRIDELDMLKKSSKYVRFETQRWVWSGYEFPSRAHLTEPPSDSEQIPKDPFEEYIAKEKTHNSLLSIDYNPFSSAILNPPHKSAHTVINRLTVSLKLCGFTSRHQTVTKYTEYTHALFLFELLTLKQQHDKHRLSFYDVFTFRTLGKLQNIPPRVADILTLSDRNRHRYTDNRNEHCIPESFYNETSDS